MKPAKTSERLFEQTRLMALSNQEVVHASAGDLPSFLRPGDVLAVNISGTLPSSFSGSIARTGASVEIRLAAFRGDHARNLSRWAAISFGSGDWRMPTEDRGPAPELREGDQIIFDTGLAARVLNVDPLFNRLLQIEFSGSLNQMYRAGRPIQYSYLLKHIQVWDQQTLFAGQPISVEAPSAAFPLNWNLLLQLKKSGVIIAPLLHGAGISSSGDFALDRKLPLDEFFEIPSGSWETIQSGRRVIALGTSVVRALESAARMNALSGYTDLKLGPATKLNVVNALITGMHEDGTSHAELMKAFCAAELLAAANKQATELGYRSHEFGDWTLIAC